MTIRTGWILAGVCAFALLSGAAGSCQSTDVVSSASRQTSPEATTSASEATSSASPPARAVGEAPDLSAFIRIDLHRLAQGPLLIAACAVFVLGFAWRFFRFSRMTRPVRLAPLPPDAVHVRAQSDAADDAFLTAGMSAPARWGYRVRRWLRRTVFSSHPVMGTVSLVFHVFLFLVPLLLPGHNVLFREAYHVSLPTLPAPLMDRLTFGLLAIGAFFLLRRIVVPGVRALSTLRDYLVLLLVLTPFATGAAAVHHWADYRTVMALHMTAGDLLIALIPFTKLGHMPFLLYARFFVSAPNALRPAGRRW